MSVALHGSTEEAHKDEFDSAFEVGTSNDEVSGTDCLTKDPYTLDCTYLP